MYDLSNINLGQKIKELRLSRGMSLETLGRKICKTKATISKYEKDEICVDILTLLEICNALDCQISNIINEASVNNNTSLNYNPFNCDKLYVYYITNDKIISSVMELYSKNNKTFVKMYNAVKDTSKYASNFSYLYHGQLVHSNIIVYFSLSNEPNNFQLENVNISLSLPWSNNANVFSAFICALTPNALPVVRKCIISKSEITNIHNYNNDLLIGPEELKNISTNNSWILENYNYNHFLLDF